MGKNLIDRLKINQEKLRLIVKSINKISKLKDPIDNTLEKWSRPNGLKIRRVSVPIGVIGVIYESRPNVTSDVACLCFKSGNAVILRGGSEALNTNKILATLFRKVCKDRDCIIFRAPDIKKIQNQIFKFEEKCYKFSEEIERCDSKKKIVPFA